MGAVVRLRVWSRTRQAEVAEAAVQSVQVLPALDEIKYRGAGGWPAGAGGGAEQFAFDSREERLSERIGVNRRMRSFAVMTMDLCD